MSSVVRMTFLYVFMGGHVENLVGGLQARVSGHSSRREGSDKKINPVSSGFLVGNAKARSAQDQGGPPGSSGADSI
jgi:hypothetical protein